MAVTIYDIAATVGVSASTVSRALRGDPGVAAPTAERIRQCAGELEYIPNASARSLLAGCSKFFGLLLPSLTHQVELEPGINLSKLAGNAGFDLMITLYHQQSDVYERMLERLIMLRVDGIFVLPPQFESHSSMVERLVRRRTPLVFIDRTPLESDGATVTVEADNITGARQLGEAALEIGADAQISCFGSINSVTRAREEGFAPFLRAPGPESKKIFIAGDHPEPVRQKAGELRRLFPGARFSAGVFDAWNADEDNFEEIFVIPQDFVAMTAKAFDTMLNMISGSGTTKFSRLTVPALPLLQFKRRSAG